MTGKSGYLAGAAAEDIVALQYARRGFDVKNRRWRGQGGEIDLIVEGDDVTVFVEVKKSRDFATAAAQLSGPQMQRIYDSAGGYLSRAPKGLDTNARFDVALVDGSGAVEILENAFGQ